MFYVPGAAIDAYIEALYERARFSAAEVQSAPPFNADAKCTKCGGGALPYFRAGKTEAGVHIPEHIRMTCACGFSWPTRCVSQSNGVG